MKDFDRRLKQLERTNEYEIPRDLANVFDTAYYDELTERQKDSYWRYHGDDERGTIRQMTLYFTKTEHFKLMRRPVVSAGEVEADIQREIAEYFERRIQERGESDVL